MERVVKTAWKRQFKPLKSMEKELKMRDFRADRAQSLETHRSSSAGGAPSWLRAIKMHPNPHIDIKEQ